MLVRVVFTIFLGISFNVYGFELLSNNSADTAGSSPPVEFRADFVNIDLLDQRNQSIKLDSLFGEDKDIVFAFFFSHCVSVCTTITLSLKSIQADLPQDTLIAMISIDPDVDTPDLLVDYAEKHSIDNPNWYLLTGDSEQIVSLQKSFEAYRGNKMNHTTSLFVKKSNSTSVAEFKTNFADIPTYLDNAANSKVGKL